MERERKTEVGARDNTFIYVFAITVILVASFQDGLRANVIEANGRRSSHAIARHAFSAIAKPLGKATVAGAVRALLTLSSR